MAPGDILEKLVVENRMGADDEEKTFLSGRGLVEGVYGVSSNFRYQV